MEANIREKQTLTSAYDAIHNSRFFVGFSGTMFGVSVMIFLRLWLILFGVYSMTAVSAVAVVELFLFIAHCGEISFVVKALIEAQITVSRSLLEYTNFTIDFGLVLLGLVFLSFQFLTDTVGITFFLNFVWMAGMSLRSGIHFRAAWVRATTEAVPPSPTVVATPVIMVQGKVVGGSPNSRV